MQARNVRQCLGMLVPWGCAVWVSWHRGRAGGAESVGWEMRSAEGKEPVVLAGTVETAVLGCHLWPLGRALSCLSMAQPWKALWSFKEPGQVSGVPGSALVLLCCEGREPEPLQPARAKTAWAPQSFPWCRRALTPLLAGLELFPSLPSLMPGQRVLCPTSPFFLAP